MNFKTRSVSNNTSGYVSESFSPWISQERWPDVQNLLQEPNCGRVASKQKFLTPSIDQVMEEFKMNGIDSPYDAEEEEIKNICNSITNTALMGLGPSSMYLRQKSWPAPEASPSVALPVSNCEDYNMQSTRKMLPATTGIQAKLEENLPGVEHITEQQLKVLSSLPNSVLYYLLKELEQNRVNDDVKPVKYNDEYVECRFCKNNGERASYYRSHRLRWQGRVVCPVLRAYRCRRCGARGDSAHTLKYCPLASSDERMQSAALLRSMRMASGRRRNPPAPSSDIASDYVVFGQMTPTLLTEDAAYNNYEPLDPIWEDLAKKLML